MGADSDSDAENWAKLAGGDLQPDDFHDAPDASDEDNIGPISVDSDTYTYQLPGHSTCAITIQPERTKV